MTRGDFDTALVAVYGRMGVTVDAFVGDTALTSSFVASVERRTGVAGLDGREVMHRLMNLRKSGRLPRLHRAYHGRRAS
jgi:hypothetical protein